MYSILSIASSTAKAGCAVLSRPGILCASPIPPPPPDAVLHLWESQCVLPAGSARGCSESCAHGAFQPVKARVKRLMGENGVRGRHRRRYKTTTDSKHNLPVDESLLACDFTPSGPNQVWTSDITSLFGPLKTGRIWRSCSTCSTARWWASRSRHACRATSTAMRLPWPGFHATRLDPSLQSRHSTPALPSKRSWPGTRHALLDESQGQLMGQRHHGELV